MVKGIIGIKIKGYILISHKIKFILYNHRCFKTYCGSNVLHTNIKLNIKINTVTGRDTNFMIELPRQLLKVYNLYENTVVSLWELALRKIYTER